MNRWLNTLTALFSSIMILSNSLSAHIGNKGPNEKPVEVAHKKSRSHSRAFSSYSISSQSGSSFTSSDLSSSSEPISSTSAPSAKISSRKPSRNLTSSGSTTSLSAQSETVKDKTSSQKKKPIQAPVANYPMPKSKKNSQKAKKAKGDKKKNRGKRGKAGKPGKRGRRGKMGPPGPRGEKGEKGDPGQGNGAQGFISALTVGFGGGANNTIVMGENIRGFQIVNNNNIAYNPVSGIFTSNAGPGYYEIHYGASWNAAQAALVLRVDGVEVNPYFDPSSQNYWARESIIVSSTSQTPTFSLGNAKQANAPMALASKGAYASAFITIKKL